MNAEALTGKSVTRVSKQSTDLYLARSAACSALVSGARPMQRALSSLASTGAGMGIDGESHAFVQHTKQVELLLLVNHNHAGEQDGLGTQGNGLGRVLQELTEAS